MYLVFMHIDGKKVKSILLFHDVLKLAKRAIERGKG